MEKIEFRELVELFLNTSVHEIKSESEVPNINFVFEEEVMLFFKDIIEKPNIKNGSLTPNAYQEDIDFLLSRSHDDCPTIYINDCIIFFEYLKEITNELIKLREMYGIKTSSRNLVMQIMRRIWLRMGIEDIENVNYFLDKQLQFVKNRTLDIDSLDKISNFYDYNIFMKTIVNDTWDETTRSIIFTINGDNKTYELPRILYDIDNDGICYIYGVQSSNNIKDKVIERKLYSLNKNIDNPNVHPSKVYALILFIEQLKNKGVTKIIVPSMQVLSYRYHELLSKKAKEDLDEIIMQLKNYSNDDYYLKKFKSIKEWYDKVYNKQDKISYLKTEELINLIYRIVEHDQSIEIINDINIQGDNLNIRIIT